MEDDRTRRKGDDIPISIELIDSDGLNISIDDLVELYVYIVHRSTSSVLVKFSKAGVDGFFALIRETEFIYRMIINSSFTKMALLGVYDLDMNVVQDDADYVGSEKNTIGIENLFVLKSSKSGEMSNG